MSSHTITIAGFVIPTNDPLFLSVLFVHVAAGYVCVVAGAVALLSDKRRGRHSAAGLVYYRAAGVVFVSMTLMAIMRWAESYHLFIIGTVSYSAAVVARRSIAGRSAYRVRLHIAAMGTSFVLLLVGFYVGNARFLPVWRSLPPVTYWVIPVLIGMSLVARAYWGHALARAERLAVRAD